MGWWKQYALDEPYPEVKVQGKNLYYASLLQDDYAGYVSEFTAISQYLYHHYYFDQVDEELGKLLEGISIIEMHHFEMLAELIIMLGGDPRIGGTYSTNYQYWDGSFPAYGHTLCERLQLDMKAERDAIRAYRHHIRLIQDPYVQAVLKRIIKDEEHHLELFQEQYEKFCKCT